MSGVSVETVSERAAEVLAALPPGERAAATQALANLENFLVALAAAIAAEKTRWAKGDMAAAHAAGYRDSKAFLLWAGKVGLRPSRKEGGVKFWDRHQIKRAREAWTGA